GILTLSGDDTFANWNAVLESVTFNYSGSVVTNPTTRKITFEANDGLLLSSTTNAFDTINIQGQIANPPIVTGTSTTPLTWTEALPLSSPPPLSIAPNLVIPDGSTSYLTSATVSIPANFSSGQDVLRWNAGTATANNIPVTAWAHSHFITLTLNSPDTFEALA